MSNPPEHLNCGSARNERRTPDDWVDLGDEGRPPQFNDRNVSSVQVAAAASAFVNMSAAAATGEAAATTGAGAAFMGLVTGFPHMAVESDASCSTDNTENTFREPDGAQAFFDGTSAPGPSYSSPTLVPSPLTFASLQALGRHGHCVYKQEHDSFEWAEGVAVAAAAQDSVGLVDAEDEMLMMSRSGYLSEASSGGRGFVPVPEVDDDIANTISGAGMWTETYSPVPRGLALDAW